jgi:two-component system, OmpR family, response regulator
MDILIAEDDGFLRTVFSNELTKAGFTVIAVEDGDAALDVMRRDPPKLVLLDVLMPKRDGFDVLAERQKDPHLQAIPVVLLTGLGQEKDIEKAMQLGASDYFSKSNLDLETLVALIHKYLAKA